MAEPIEQSYERSSDTDAALEARARRAAGRVGLYAMKTRCCRGTVDNYGQFMIMEPNRNRVVAGERFNMSAQQVIDYCAQFG